MCQVHTGAYVSLLAPGKTDYTVCHPRKTTTYILHVVPITTHTDDRRKSIGEKKQKKGKIKGRKSKKAKNEKGKERKEKTRTKKKKKQEKTSIPNRLHAPHTTHHTNLWNTLKIDSIVKRSPFLVHQRRRWGAQDSHRAPSTSS